MAVLGDLQLQVTRPIYETWLKDTEGIAFSGSRLTVGVPSPFAVDWLERRIYQLIEKTAQKVAGHPVEVQFRVRNPAPGTGGDALLAAAGQGVQFPRNAPPRLELNGKYNFNSFVVGPSNQLSFSGAQAVAEFPGKSYNPLFIYSGVGLGKTHLLHAIGHTCVSKGLSCIYVTCEQFTNEFISSIRSRTTEEFRTRYRSVEVLLIDDIQFISGKEQTQEGFFHTFNELHNANRQLVLTSDRPPKAISSLEDRLRSRFEWGLIADVQPPDLETRMAILRAKAEQMDITLTDNVIEYTAMKMQRNVRELEGGLNRIVALARFSDRPVTLELASEAMTEYVADLSRSSVDPDKIIDEVANTFGVSGDELVGPSRRKRIVRARHVAMYLLHEDLGMTDTAIGRLLGGRNHSTVVNAVGKVHYEINVDSRLRRDIIAVKEAIFS